jgi:hypothetical protein
MASVSDIIRRVTDAADAFDPIIQRIGNLQSGGDQVLRERIEYGQLNGSGPNNPREAANSAPTSERQYFFENPIRQTERAEVKSMFDAQGLLILGIVAFGFFLLFRSKRL